MKTRSAKKSGILNAVGRGIRVAKRAATVFKAARSVKNAVKGHGKKKQKTKHGTEERKIDNSNDGATTSFFTRSIKMRKKGALIKLLGSPNFYTFNATGRAQGSVGLQFPIAALYTFDEERMRLIYEAAASATTITANKTANVLFDSCYGILEFTNVDQSMLNYCIYDLVAKRDIPANWGAGADNSGFNAASPVTAWDFGEAQTITPNTSIASQFVGQMPQNSAVFRKYWKVMKKSHGWLRPGQVNKHIINHKLHRVINRDELTGTTAAAGNRSVMGGVTTCCMIVLRGSLANDQTKGAGTVTFTAPAIDFFQSYSYRYRFISPIAEAITVVNTLGTSFASGPSIMDMMTDTVIAATTTA